MLLDCWIVFLLLVTVSASKAIENNVAKQRLSVQQSGILGLECEARHFVSLWSLEDSINVNDFLEFGMTSLLRPSE